jgi:probable H4MPT-linked C1 transfer pathway protein
MNWLALDIGGANLKAATGTGFATHRSFALWREHRRLAGELRTVLAESPPCDHLVVTMTGELADCFETKTQGVQQILKAVAEAADGRHTRVYLVDGRLVAPTVAERMPLLVAAANWRALATFCQRFVPSDGAALVIDIGSTTCDVIPLEHNAVTAIGTNDTERLLAGELIYCGIDRTPICGLVSTVPYRTEVCPIMPELFATTKDVYVMTGALDEDGTDSQTADRRPATKRYARLRLSRMIGADETQFHIRDAVRLAQHVVEAHIDRIAQGVQKVLSRCTRQPATVILAGEGEFLARRVLAALNWNPAVFSLSQRLGPGISKAAPAHALAVLAREAIEQR